MSRTALIDADGLIYIVCYNKAIRDELGVEIGREAKTLDECKASIDGIIRNILGTIMADSYLVFLTVGRNFRYEVYPEYKANRKSLEKPEHFDRIKEYLITEYKAIYHHKLEADDLCLIYSKVLLGSIICSPDKDMLGLEGKHFNYSKFEWVTTDKQQAHYNFWSSMITGDTADNIKGIPGKGEKFAEKLFKEVENTAEYSTAVLFQYIDKFGEEKGVEEFYKNYKVLKIKSEYEGLTLVDPIEFRRVVEDEQEKGDSWDT